MSTATHSHRWTATSGRLFTGFLDYQRATFAWTSANLTPAQLSQRLPRSMTMAGPMKDLAYVEDDWFGP